MKVALFTETYVPDVNGVVAHVQTLKNGLEALGHEVLVVAADKHCKHHYVYDGVLHCPSIEAKKFYGFGVAAPYSRKRLKLLRDFDPDIIHIHHEFGIGLSGIVYAKLYGKPLVYTLHTMYDQYIYYIAPRPFLNTATKFSHQYERFIAYNANMLTGPSAKCDEYFKRIGVRKEINIIPNSADTEAFDYTRFTPEKKAERREKLGIPADSMIVCFAGRLGKEKSVDVLMEFWAKTIKREDKLHLMVMGDGPDKEALMLLAKGLKIDDMVTFTGMVDHKEMPLQYSISDVFASASLSEMNSISMLESMACGLPVLQRYDEMNADQIQDGVNGYLFNTAENMYERLMEIRRLSDDELAGLKKQVRDSMYDRGSISIARYMLTIYDKAKEERDARKNDKSNRQKFRIAQFTKSDK
ncbi:glycosyltransferase [Ruminococcaceae bacterium OttesenSCG-928-L11]|nr:glycosyltransferase [Ruminococcaceae bacterium OttesenSCG-928-L11]